ncbi:MAG: hypothetical protein GQ574_26030 [Crocinitomix sp.]|nr:hypothetical protein [Crocinitomix sp.]
MASSFIEIDEIGFWANDAFVEAVQLTLIDEIEHSQFNSVKWITEYKVQLALQSIPMIYGGMSLMLEEYLVDDSRKAIVIGFCESIIDKIVSAETYFTGLQLHEFRKRAMRILQENGELNFKSEIEFNRAVDSSSWNQSSLMHTVKHRYVQAFELVISLIKGEMNTTASSPEDYWNY